MNFDLTNLIDIALSLAGFGSLIGLLVNVLKMTGVVKDGTANIWSAGLNLLLLITLYVSKVIGFDLVGLDGLVGQIANIGVAVLALLTQMTGAKAAHGMLRGVPVIGKSFRSEVLE